MRCRGLRVFFGMWACLCLHGSVLRAEVVIERLSNLVGDVQPSSSTVIRTGAEPSSGKSLVPKNAPATMMGALSILEGNPANPPAAADTHKPTGPNAEGAGQRQLQNLWQMRRMAIRMGDDEAALQSERRLEEALLARRALSPVSTSEEIELAYLLILEAAGAERVGASSSAAALVYLAGLAGANLPAVHLARARLAWGGTGDFGTVTDGLMAAWGAVLRNEILVSHLGAGFVLCFVLAYVLCLLWLGITLTFVLSRYALVDLQSRAQTLGPRWKSAMLLLMFVSAPLLLGLGPLFSSLMWLSGLGAYLSARQQQLLRGVAALAVGLPYGAWLGAWWMTAGAHVQNSPTFAAALPVTADEVYRDLASPLFAGLSWPLSTLCLLGFPFLWGWLWQKIAARGIVRACQRCGAATARRAADHSERGAPICHLCDHRVDPRSREDIHGAESNRAPTPDGHRTTSRGFALFWTLCWPGTGHVLVGQIGRGFRYGLCGAFLMLAWGWWASPIPWPEPVLVGESTLIFWGLVVATMSLYSAAVHSVWSAVRAGGHHGT